MFIQQTLSETDTYNIVCNMTATIIIQNACKTPLVLCHFVFAGLGV